MDLHTPLLLLHAAAGTLGLLLGPVAAFAAARRRVGAARLLAAYQIAVTLVCVSAVGLVGLAPTTFWWLIPVALGTLAAIVVAGRTTNPARRTRLLGGSYVSLVTALLVVSWGSPLAWIIPTVLGVGLVESASGRTHRRSASQLSQSAGSG